MLFHTSLLRAIAVHLFFIFLLASAVALTYQHLQDKDAEAARLEVTSGTDHASTAGLKPKPVKVSSVQSEAGEADEAESVWSNYPAVEVVATGYYAGVESTGKSPGHPEYGITYSGLKVHRDENTISTIAADPEVFPLGTILYIPGYGYGIVADTGSAIKGNVIDLYFETKEDVFAQWGKKQLQVYIVESGPGEVTEAMFQQKINEYSSNPAPVG